MKLLIVTEANPWVRSIATVHRYAAAGARLGHDVAVFGPTNADLPDLRFTTDLKDVDLALFVLQVPSDLPDMPDLARLLDGLPREKRAVADLWGRYNETIRVDHDFNHLEKLDGHLGWEWEDAIRSISDRILQPSLQPRRPDVRSFLFHGFDPGSVVKPHTSAKEAANAWSGTARDHGVMYIGSNWQRWHQVRAFLDGYRDARSEVGKVCLAGWDWDARPDWAVQKGIHAVDTDPALLKELGVEIWNGLRFDEIVNALGKARFAPVLHRPLFRELGFVTNRTFETFYADTVPVLMLPKEFVEAIYGPGALALVPKGTVADHLRSALRDPVAQWDAILKTREHLTRTHGYERRFQELAALAGARS
jgi:hypothetical protein